MKRNEQLLHAIGEINDQYIEEASIKPARIKRKPYAILGLVMAFVLMMAVIPNMFISNVEATIALDVNPSLEIEINDKEKVLAVNALNEDAKIVVGDMNFKNVDLEVAMNALIGSMLKEGYINIDQNSILVSVKSDNQEKAKLLQDNISEEISKILQGKQISPSILTQTYETDAKTELVNKVVESGLKDVYGNAYTTEQLKDLNVNELKLLVETKPVEVQGVQSTGQASSGRYISKEEALNIAYQTANLQVSSVTYTHCEMDYDDGVMYYEIELRVGNNEYDFEIDAKTGTVHETDYDIEPTTNQTPTQNTTPTTNKISKDEALNKAYSHVGVSNPTLIKCELDEGVYEIEFFTNDTEYDIDVRANDGAILDVSKEMRNTVRPSTPTPDPTPTPQPQPSNKISRDEALSIAYNHAGVNASEARDVDCEFDDGVYEVDFQIGYTEYEYKIDPSSGAVLYSHKEIDD